MVIQSKKVWLADQFVPAAIEVNDGRITAILPYGTKDVDDDYGDKRIVPGFMDIHCHGAYEFDTNDANEDGLRCAPGDTRDFMRHLSDPDPAARTFRVYTLLALPGTLLAALALSRLGPMGFVRCWLILLLGATPCAAMLSFVRPFSALARRLASFGAALCGWHGARVLGGKHTVILRDEDVFPANNITSSGMKLYLSLIHI